LTLASDQRPAAHSNRLRMGRRKGALKDEPPGEVRDYLRVGYQAFDVKKVDGESI